MPKCRMASTEQTYLFYDIETTGLNKCFDQVLQFAAIRTDLALNELERFEYSVALRPDVIPSPGAIITHRIGVHQTQDGLNEYDATQKIHALLNEPGTISVGYNTLGFDDEFLRFSFYRNLLAPYTHQFANHCSRMDLYPILVVYYLYKPTVLEWPIVDDKVSLKLENLSKLNKLAQGQAHDAMVDVEATIALAKKLIAEKEMWDYVTGYFNKKVDLARTNKLPTAFTLYEKTYRESLLVNGKLGKKLDFQAPVLQLGTHRHFKNQSLWLRLDLPELQKTTLDNISEMTYVIKKRAGEPPLLLPMHERFLQKINPERLAIAEKNKQWLQDNTEILKAICHYHMEFKYEEVPNCDIDAALYQIGFPSQRDEFLFRQFHEAIPTEKANIVKQFPNAQRREQAWRVLGRFYLEHLSDIEKAVYEDYIQHALTNSKEKRLINFKNEYSLTLCEAREQLAELLEKNELDEQQKSLLVELNEYYDSLTECQV